MIQIIVYAIRQMLVDELVEQIEHCRACVEGVRLCQRHHTAAKSLFGGGCDEPDCWTCLPPERCGAPFRVAATDAEERTCMLPVHNGNDHAR